MPRSARKESSTGIYHIVVRGADHQQIFSEPDDYLKYLDLLEFYQAECNFELYAFCLMPNHVHLLLRTTGQPLPYIFRRLNTAYAIWFNGKYERCGFLQQGRYYSEPVEDNRYLVNVIRYIHQNPQKAGLESYPGASYPWSSMQDYKTGTSRFIKFLPVWEWFGGKEQFLSAQLLTISETCLDVENTRKRLPDDVARKMICREGRCDNPSDIGKYTILQRNQILISLHKKGISIRQLNRLTEIPKGIISRIVEKEGSA